MESRGQVEHAGTGEQSEGGYGGVDVEAGRKAYRDDQTYEFGAAKLHASQHIWTPLPPHTEKRKGSLAATLPAESV
jgi:hypothetical protein